MKDFALVGRCLSKEKQESRTSRGIAALCHSSLTKALNGVHYKDRILLCFLTRICFAKWFLNSTGGLVSSPWFKRTYKQDHLNSKYAQAVFWFHRKNPRTRQNRWYQSPLLQLILAVLLTPKRVREVLRQKTNLMFSGFFNCQSL